MKTYHSINRYSYDYLGKYIYAFDKIDGSNFRVEWDRKLSKKSNFTFGFKKFGTRNEIISKYNPFIEAVSIFENKYAESFNKIFISNKLFQGINKITIFGEFFGDNSFAGLHNWDEYHDLIFFDIFLYKKDYLTPSLFIKTFENLINIPKLVYKGILTELFIKEIESNIELKEGVVIKGVDNDKIFMEKIKTKKWLNKVRDLYGEQKMIEY